MANVKISELNELTQVDDDDLLVVVDTSANETKKIRAENVGTGGGGDSTPIGTIEAFSGSTAPNGYLLCDGSAISRNAYADLFAVIGTTYGSGDGSTTFNLPNLKGRTVVMQDTTQTEFDTIGETGGSKNLQEHTHTINAIPVSTYNSNNYSDGTNNAWVQYTDGFRTTNSAGTGNSGNLQPYIVLNYVIKAFKVSSTPATSQVVNAYSESTSDAYSCDYVNNSDSYSTSEVKTNKRWIDNKPIYRKNLTVDTGTTLDLWSSIAHNINNVDFIMIINAFFVNGNGDKEILPNSDIQVAINNTNIRLVLKSASMKNRNMTLIVEYTKTTDV